MWALALGLRGPEFPRKSLGFVPFPLRINTFVVYVGPGPGPQGPRPERPKKNNRGQKKIKGAKKNSVIPYFFLASFWGHYFFGPTFGERPKKNKRGQKKSVIPYFFLDPPGRRSTANAQFGAHKGRV